jgi:hypothetical protein
LLVVRDTGIFSFPAVVNIGVGEDINNVVIKLNAKLGQAWKVLVTLSEIDFDQLD